MQNYLFEVPDYSFLTLKKMTRVMSRYRENTSIPFHRLNGSINAFRIVFFFDLVYFEPGAAFIFDLFIENIFPKFY